MTDELYSKRLPLIIRIQNHEDRKTSIHISVEVNHATAPLSRKELVIRLTDEKDVFFLFTLRLSEDDFQELKNKQSLLVDFDTFPKMLIELLELCLKDEHKEVPKYVLHLFCNGSSLSCASDLKIIETNALKHLTHLSLKFLPGTDSDVKCYLAECLKTLKEQNATLLQRFQSTESDLKTQLRQTREALNSQTQELTSLKAEWTAKINELNNSHGQQLNMERDRALQTQTNLQQKYERERKELEQAHLKIVKQLESRCCDFDTSNKDLTDVKLKSEAILRELKSRLSLSEEENSRLKQDVHSLRKENVTVAGASHEKDKMIGEMKTRIAVLDQEVKDKIEVMTKTSEMLEVQQNIRRNLESELEQKKQEVVKEKKARKSQGSEVQKGNDIIRKLQADLKHLNNKLTLSSQIATEQEKVLKEKQGEIEERKREIETVQKTLHQTEEDNRKLNESLESMLKKLKESQERLEHNKKVIEWLEKKLTEAQLSQQQHIGFEASSFGPSPATVHRPPPPSAVQNTFGSVQSTSYGFSPQSSGSARLPTVMSGKMPTPSVVQSQNNFSNSLPTERIDGTRPTTSLTNQPKAVDPFLDPKYLQQADDKIFRTQNRAKASTPPSIIFPPAQIPVRLGKNLVAEPPKQDLAAGRNSDRTKLPQPALASAYFPSKPL